MKRPSANTLTCPFSASSHRLSLMCLALALALAFSCSSPASQSKPQSGQEYGIAYSKQFDIEYRDGGIRIVTDSRGNRFLLVPDGADIPGDAAQLPIVQVPIRRGIFLSSTQIGFMEPIADDSVYDTIVGLATNPATFTVPGVLERAGSIAWLSQTNSNVDVESALELAPDVVFLDTGMGDPAATSARFESAGAICIQTSDYLEENSMAFAEWAKFFGAFYCLDDKADAYVKETKVAIDGIIAKTAALSSDQKPLVAFGLYYNGVIYTPASDSVTAALVAQAGGTYYLPDLPGTGSVQLTAEEFFDRSRDADIFVCTTRAAFIADMQALAAVNPLFAQMKAYESGSVYIQADGYYMNNGKVTTKLQDMTSIFAPSLGYGNSGSFFVKLQ